jgi:hypothetical protein
MSNQEETYLEPCDIYGNWTVKNIQLPQGAAPIGIEATKSKFKIVSGHILQKKYDVKNVRWNGDDLQIQLGEITDFRRNAGFVLGATILLDNVEHELLLGSVDYGVTLKVMVRKKTPSANPGGEGSAGRP